MNKVIKVSVVFIAGKNILKTSLLCPPIFCMCFSTSAIKCIVPQKRSGVHYVSAGPVRAGT